MDTTGTILIVDDDWMNRELLQVHLETEGYRVLYANNGQKALEMAPRDLPDLILMDVRMPGLSGYETCQRLKADPTTQHIPILMMTAFDNDEAKLKGLQSGADDFLTKPYDMMIVLARVRSLIRIKRLYDELVQRDRRLQDVLKAHLDAKTAQLILDDLAR